jgi:hypothetical protein
MLSTQVLETTSKKEVSESKKEVEVLSAEKVQLGDHDMKSNENKVKEIDQLKDSVRKER